MELQGRNLSINMKGEDVKLLHGELRKLGYTIPDNELAEHRFGQDTRKAVLDFQKQRGLEITGVVDDQTASLINQEVTGFVVRGEVRRADGEPLVGAEVRAFDVDLRRWELLGQTATDQKGFYAIRFTRQKFSRAEKANPDLVVRVYDAQGQELVASDILFNAKPEETVNLMVGGEEYKGPSEFERLVEEIRPLVEGMTVEGVEAPTFLDKVADLRDDEKHQDIGFLVGETGLPRERIEFLITAARLAEKTKIVMEIFYGLFRENLPTSLAGLVVQDREVVRRALETAINQNIIPLRIRNEIDGFLNRLKELMADQLYEKSEQPGRPSLGELLETAKLSADLQRQFVREFVNHEGPFEEFWNKLRENPDFGSTVVDDVQFTLQAAELAQNHLPMVEYLQKERQGGKLQGLDDLASRRVEEGENNWIEPIKGHGQQQGTGFPPDTPGETPDEKIMNYARSLARRIENTFPTQVIAHRIAAEDDFPGKEDVVRFLQNNNPRFDLMTTNVDVFVREKGDAAFAGVSDRKGTIRQVKSMQRLLRVTPDSGRYEAMRALQRSGFDSSIGIAWMGKGAFDKRYAQSLGGQTRAREIYNRARHRSALALAVFSKYSAAFHSLPVIGEWVRDVADVPNWNELFGPPVLCECEHCRSVYSPAAYLVDLLQWLKTDVGASAPYTSALAVLLERRPDLGEIELSCENTNTPLPYVDLLNEILEQAVSPVIISGASAFTAGLNAGSIPAVLWGELADRGITLATDAPVSVETPGSRWRISDRSVKYIIQKDADTLRVSVMPQTTGSAEELKANPEHISPAAYDKLANEAVYPWDLPFSLWAEEARVYLEHLGIRRSKLMAVFHRGAPPADLTDPAIAREYLGLTIREAEIITGGIHVRAATTGPITLSGPQTIDGVVLAADDLVLVKNQASASDNALYVVKDGDWERSPHMGAIGGARPSRLVTVREGTQYEWTNWMLTDAGGSVDIAEASWEFWGLEAGSGLSIADPIDSSADPEIGDWDRVLARVSIFMQRSDLTYKEVLELLDTRFINPPGAATRMSIRSTDTRDEATCNVSKLAIQNLTRDTLHKIHRFVRLQRKLGWTIRDLDRAIAAFGARDINAAFLRRLFHVRRLQTELKVPLIQVLSWWSTLDTAVYEVEKEAKIRPFYEQLFLNKTVLNPEDMVFQLNSTRSELADTTENITANAPAILAALQISDADLADLLDNEVSDQLNLANLSHLYRIVSFSKALNLSVQGLLAVKALTGINPFDARRTDNTLQLVEKVRKIRSSAFSIAELDYLLQHKYEVSSSIVPSEESIALLLYEIRDGLKKIIAETTVVPDPTGDLARRSLALVLESETVDEAMAILIDVEPRDTTARTQQDAFIQTQLDKFLADPAQIADAQAQLVGSPPSPPGLTTKEARFAYILARLLPYLQESISRNFVVQKLAEALKLEVAAAERLLVEALTVASGTEKAITAFLASGFTAGSEALTETAFPAPFRTFRKLHKAATVISKLKIRPGELPWIVDHGPRLGWLDLDALPLTVEPAPPPERFVGWERVVDLFKLVERSRALREKLTSEEWEGSTEREGLRAPFGLPDDTPLPGMPALLVVFDLARQFPTTTGTGRDPATAEAELWRLLSERTGWERDDIEFLVSSGGFGFTFPETYTDEKWLLRLKACFQLVKRLGVSAGKMRPWANAHVSADDARSIKQAVKAKYDEKRWLQVAKPLRDALREKQRAALVSYLVAENDLLNSNGLYQYLLIDPEMSACMMTSRIKQAISSVQLFVQRCLMGLEPEVNPDEDNAREWEWRKNYRVWEANRKVFLYPENWIEPELRDDKSPFFKDLENALLQNEITEETVEAAYIEYLRKLDEVARLEIAGVYQEEDTKLLHVFGRTRNEPHIYYYRRWVDEAYWSPWERVDVDIEGDHLIPVVWNRRLFLFWPIFTEKAEEKETRITQSDTGNPPKKYWTIQIAWGEYRNGKWSAKKATGDLVDTASGSTMHPLFPTRKQFYFNTWTSSDEETLTLEIHFQLDSPTDGIRSGWYPLELATCNNEFKVKPTETSPTGARLGPVASRTWYMGFESGSGDLQVPNEYVRHDHPPILILNSSPPDPYYIASQHQREIGARRGHWLVFKVPFFYQDRTRTFFVALKEYADFLPSTGVLIPGWVEPLGGVGGRETEVTGSTWKFEFVNFYHPYACLLIEQLNRRGVDGILDPEGSDEVFPPRQQIIGTDYFRTTYDPNLSRVATPLPRDKIDFSAYGPYAPYNWELFFHIPLLIADRLSKNQRFEEAQRWFHYIFDPTADAHTSISGMPYWKVRPFFEATADKSIRDLMVLLAENPTGLSPDERRDRDELIKQVDAWRDDPFNPHLIARLRLMAYQKAVVMKYLDNLIAWGDQLFRRDTIESINEAAQLYILAAEILGPRPVTIPPRGDVPAKTYNELLLEVRPRDLDAFSNVLVEIENLISDGGTGTGTGITAGPDIPILYFCIPKNDKLLGYWNIVQDRLFKIRHCMTIEGVVRELPLFEPPIEPGLLVRARAMGVDLRSALSDINSALPHYRFQVMLQKALEFCNDVKALGASLLAALEKRDAEQLALIRSGHEMNLLTAVREVRAKQVEESKRSLDALTKAKQLSEIRYVYYRDIEGISSGEQLHMDKLGEAFIFNQLAHFIQFGVSAAYVIPNFQVGSAGWAGSPVATTSFGGDNLGAALNAGAGLLEMIASKHTHEAEMASVRGGYDRRWDDWKLQESLAAREIEQAEKQIAAAEIRLAIAEKELDNHDKQIENAQQVDEYMRNKFSNQELYNWMVSQISTIYFQSYQLAYDLAKRAEKAFQHELGVSDAKFIQFGYWDSLKKGLLSGEKLYYDLKRMEVAYLEQNKREYEITKHISLTMLDPIGLIKLKETGECFVNLPEAIFDLDYPGHYMRRVKSVSLTIPCVTGPYTSVNCTLTLLSSRVRKETSTDGGHDAVSHFSENFGAVQSIATSSGQNDSGLFELNFRDERYLPFEGAGVISEWRLELSGKWRTGPGPEDIVKFPQFDFDTISDVIFHIRYTARDGGEILKAEAVRVLRDQLDSMMTLAEGRAGFFRIFSARHEFPSEWHRFLYPNDTADRQTLELPLTAQRFPFLFRGKTVTITRVELFLKLKGERVPETDRTFLREYADGTALSVLLSPPGTPPEGVPLQSVSAFIGGIPHAVVPETGELGLQLPLTFVLEASDTQIGAIAAGLRRTVTVGEVDHYRLNPDAIEDLFIVCHYRIT